MAVAARFSLPPEREGHPRQTRHRSAEIQNCDFRERLFLARTRWLQQIRHTEIECRILGEQDPHQQSPRREESPHSAGSRLECDRCLGMRAEIILFRRDDGENRLPDRQKPAKTF